MWLPRSKSPESGDRTFGEFAVRTTHCWTRMKIPTTQGWSGRLKASSDEHGLQR